MARSDDVTERARFGNRRKERACVCARAVGGAFKGDRARSQVTRGSCRACSEPVHSVNFMLRLQLRKRTRVQSYFKDLNRGGAGIINFNLYILHILIYFIYFIYFNLRVFKGYLEREVGEDAKKTTKSS